MHKAPKHKDILDRLPTNYTPKDVYNDIVTTNLNYGKGIREANIIAVKRTWRVYSLLRRDIA